MTRSNRFRALPTFALTAILVLTYVVTAAAQNQYITYFNKTENPISEFSSWQVPGSTANQWGNMRTNGTHIYGVSEPTQFGDPTAILTGAWQANQSIQANIYVSSIPASCCHEAEVRLRSSISTNSITGYEILCPVHASPGYGIQIVRWNGTNGQFVYLNTGAAHQCKDKDVILATATGTNPTTITVSITGPGGSASLTACDNGGSGSGGSCGGNTFSGPGGAAGPWTTGNPGVGVYGDQDSPGADPLFPNYGLYGVAATNGTIRQAASCSGANVATAIGTASSGDFVYASAGTCSWSGSTISVNGITLFGAGKDATRGTLITAGSFTQTKNATIPSRLEGFRFTGTDVHGTISGTVSNRAFIIGNSYFNSNGTTSFLNINADGGLIYNTDFFAAATHTPGADILMIHPGVSWSQPTTFGTADTQGPYGGERNLYFEDSTCTNVYETCPDGDQGNRLVMRHFTWTDSSVVMHGGGAFNDTSGVGGGAQQMEIYDSTFVRSDVDGVMNKWIWMRGETGVIANNTMANDTSSSYPNKNNIQLGVGCNNDSPSYPVAQQIGQSTTTVESPPSHPLLIFGNTGGATTSGHFIVVQENATGGGGTTSCPNPGNYVQASRDYYTSNQWSWSPFTYPHPLRLASPAASGTPILSVSPGPSYFFGSFAPGSPSSPQAFTVSNTGTATATISSITVTGGNSSDFSIGSGSCSATPFTLAAGNSCTKNVTFTPGAAGPRSTTFTVTDTPDTLTATSSLSGSGTVVAPASGLFATISKMNLEHLEEFNEKVSALYFPAASIVAGVQPLLTRAEPNGD